MKPFSSWIKSKTAQLLPSDEPTSPTTATNFISADSSPIISPLSSNAPALPISNPEPLACACHPEIVPQPLHQLCSSCAKFVRKCHWIRLHKLPPSQLACVSRDELEAHGSYVADGDASGELGWDYDFGEKILKAGCHLCGLIASITAGQERALKMVGGDGAGDFRLGVKLTVWWKGSLCVYLTDEDGGEVYGVLRLFHAARSDLITLTKRTPNEIDELLSSSTTAFSKTPLCTGSSAHFALAKHWIDTCLSSHPECLSSSPALLQQTASKNKYPSRLVYVGNTTVVPRLHLVSRRDDAYTPYLTLSHCWGGTSPLKLLKSNIQDLQKAITFSTLPKNFQDAIIVTRGIGYEYLWIDSLCIIQDDTHDWATESKIMGDIYRGSVCTIAATASKDGDGGCFRVLPTLLDSGPCRLWSADQVEGEEQRGIYVDIDKDEVRQRYRRDVDDAPLNSRAWVLQERVLSQRTLHFSQGGMYFDCFSKRLSDDGHEVTGSLSSSDLRNEPTSAFTHPSTPSSPETDSKIDDEEFASRWQTGIELYSSRKLTQPADRLTAFLGIINNVQNLTTKISTYGLFKSCLLSNLLWRNENLGIPPHTNPDSTSIKARSRIPSWSWAAISGQVRYSPPAREVSISNTFWDPEDLPNFPPSKKHKRNEDVKDMARAVASEVLEHMRLGVDPVRGYRSRRVWCARYIDLNTNERDDGEHEGSSGVICIQGKLSPSPGGAKVMLLNDEITPQQGQQLKSALHLPPERQLTLRTFLAATTSSNEGYRIIITMWPDYPLPSSALLVSSSETRYLPLFHQGGAAPNLYRFFGDGWVTQEKKQRLLLAAYALYSVGLVLVPEKSPIGRAGKAEEQEERRHYRRVGYFRCIETFDRMPSPHPKGVDATLQDGVLRGSWFGGVKEERLWLV